MKFLKSLWIFVLVFSMLTMASCDLFKEERFGEFGFYDHYLTKYSKEELSASEAKELIIANAQDCGLPLESAIPGIRDNDLPLPSDDLVTAFTSRYADCEVKTTYYIDDGDEEIKYDYLQGTDFKAIIGDNIFSPFNQVVAKIVVLFPEIIDYMEEQNQQFKGNEKYDTYPFKTLFSYHKDSEGCLVIQCRDFAEIPASEAGGVACNYRQDTEIIFDKLNKIERWQTSLGVYTATPTGTITQGYILMMDFEWHEKM